MGSEKMRQLTALSDLFKRVLDYCRPRSVAVLGVAGGNGLERIESKITKRIVALDINPQYLDAVQKRFATLPGLELHCADSNSEQLHISRRNWCTLRRFSNTPNCAITSTMLYLWSCQEARLSIVLQLASELEQSVAVTEYSSMQTLKEHFALINVGEFCRLLEQKGFHLLERLNQSPPGGKGLWLGIFGRTTINRSSSLNCTF